MSWHRIDDSLDENQKQLRMSDGAFRIWICSMTFCARQEPITGFLSEAQAVSLARKLSKSRRTIEELVRLNGWEQVDGGYLIHDFEEYIERGSRDRTRQWREQKRVTSHTRHRDVTPSSPQRHGDVTVTSLARDGYPVPEPVPVKVLKEPVGDKARARPYVENPVDNWRPLAPVLERYRSQEARA